MSSPTKILQEIGEQIGHIAWALGALAVFTFTPIPVLDGVLAGLVLALPRELIDQWPIQRPWDTVLDLSMFAVGGGIAGLLRSLYG